MRKYQILAPSSVVLIAAVVALAFVFPAREAPREADDRQEVIDHIDGIFNAYIRQDKEAVRAMHTQDWMGFKGNSRTIVKGIDGYMQNVLTGASHLLDYEMEEIEVDLYGDIAHVYYVANWRSRLTESGQVFTIRSRSLDIYRREAQGWIQSGSHLTILPRPGRFGNPVCAQECIDVTLVQQ